MIYAWSETKPLTLVQWNICAVAIAKIDYNDSTSMMYLTLSSAVDIPCYKMDTDRLRKTKHLETWQNLCTLFSRSFNTVEHLQVRTLTKS